MQLAWLSRTRACGARSIGARGVREAQAIAFVQVHGLPGVGGTGAALHARARFAALIPSYKLDTQVKEIMYE